MAVADSRPDIVSSLMVPQDCRCIMQTITLVDYDEDILTSVLIALGREGYIVTTYRDGASALSALKKSASDLIIIALEMPRMDGMEMLRRLRQTSNIPVILLTSKNDDVDEVLGLKMGADDFIRKPFSRAFTSVAGSDFLANRTPVAITSGDIGAKSFKTSYCSE